MKNYKRIEYYKNNNKRYKKSFEFDKHNRYREEYYYDGLIKYEGGIKTDKCHRKLKII